MTDILTLFMIQLCILNIKLYLQYPTVALLYMLFEHFGFYLRKQCPMENLSQQIM
jgi:hypothetical protein